MFEATAPQTIGRGLSDSEQRLVVAFVQQAGRQAAHGTYDSTYGDCVYQEPPTLNDTYASYFLTQMFPTDATATRIGSYGQGVENMLRGCDYSGANCRNVQPDLQSSP